MDRTDGTKNCSITVHLRQAGQVSGGGVLFEACRVGSVEESDGSMKLNWDLGELTSLRPSMSTERVTNRLSELLFGRADGAQGDDFPASLRDVEIRTAVTASDGTCTFGGLESGAWLIHASDSSAYGRIEDTLAAVPCYVQEGLIWTGPVYDADIWPKGEITGKSTEETQQTPKPGEEPRRETEKRTQKLPPSETEHTVSEQEETKVPESGKKTRNPVTETATGKSTEVVKTLDDTPVSAALCAMLTCGLIIAMIAVRLKKAGRRKKTGHMLLALGAGIVLASAGAALSDEVEADAIDRMLETESRIVFFNESPSAPCLTVSKEVLDAENGSRAPSSDRFTFRLNLDGERAAGVRYRIFDEDGTEYVDLTGNGVQSLVPAGSAAGDPAALRTGRDGSFTLRGGQYALFEEVRAGQLWEVTELVSDAYERVVPLTSGTVSGTMERNGSHAQFVNRYDPGGDPEYTEGVLEITKLILWPENCSLPERGSFPVRVLVDGKAWAGMPVELKGIQDTAPLEHRRTDGDGIFEIRGMQRAFLRGLPVGADLIVEETDDPLDLFVPSGDTTWKGAVSSLQKVTFTNRLADFVVAKSLRSGDPQHRFLFCLLDAQNHPWKGASYYLVQEDGRAAQGGPLVTDDDGHFTLCAGQRAVFTGMEEGTRFRVREERILGYRQVMPLSADGYTGVMTRNTVPSLLFENEMTDVRMFVPTAGGSGIALILAAAAVGMAGAAVLLRRGRLETFVYRGGKQK